MNDYKNKTFTNQHILDNLTLKNDYEFFRRKFKKCL